MNLVAIIIDRNDASDIAAHVRTRAAVHRMKALAKGLDTESAEKMVIQAEFIEFAVRDGSYIATKTASERLADQKEPA